jgi:hypothetical protein
LPRIIEKIAAVIIAAADAQGEALGNRGTTAAMKAPVSS